MPQLDRRRPELDLHGDARRHGRRIGVRAHPHAPQPVDAREAHLGQLKPVAAGQRQQVLALDGQRLAHRLGAASQRARLVGAAGGQQQAVELFEVARGGHRDPVVAAEGAHLTLDATLFVALTRRTEAGLEAPVRAERHEARRLLAPEAAQDLLHRGAEVVVPQPAVDAARCWKASWWASRNACCVARGYARWNAAPVAMLRGAKTCSL
jgi:hypothetical protein